MVNTELRAVPIPANGTALPYTNLDRQAIPS